MKNYNQKRFIVLLVCFMSFITVLNAQNKTAIGIDFVNDIVDDAGGQQIRPGVGLFMQSGGKHSGIEAGVYYRTYMQSVSFRYEGNSYDADIRESHLSIPILYKFSSRIVNFSAGPSFEIFLGWKQTSSTAEVEFEDYDIDPNYNIGAMFKLGKDIKLGDKLQFEPELRFNPIFGLQRLYLGLGLRLKLDV